MLFPSHAHTKICFHKNLSPPVDRHHVGEQHLKSGTVGKWGKGLCDLVGGAEREGGETTTRNGKGTVQAHRPGQHLTSHWKLYPPVWPRQPQNYTQWARRPCLPSLLYSFRPAQPEGSQNMTKEGSQGCICKTNNKQAQKSSVET